MGEITFRSITKRDLALIAKWAEQPHWLEWWGEAEKSLDGIKAAMDDDATEPMLALLNDRPIAYVQTYDPHMEDDHPYQDQPYGTLGIDLTLGDATMLGQGHGPAILEALTALLFEEGAPRLIIDPDPQNSRAIRAYEKAGFAAFDRRTSVYGPALMMARDNPEFESEG
jgi:aminoglycoside 6'-N-acetyltransferase